MTHKNEAVYKIDSRGDIHVNGGLIRDSGPNTPIVGFLDLDEKHAEVHAYFGGDETGCGLTVGVGPRTMFDDETHTPTGNDTLIMFPFPQYDVFCAEVSRYTLAFTLIPKGYWG